MKGQAVLKRALRIIHYKKEFDSIFEGMIEGYVSG